MLFPRAEVPIPLVHVRHGGGDDDHFVLGDSIIQNLSILILGFADEVDGDVHPKGLGETGLKEGLTAELGGVKGKWIGGRV